MSLNGSLFNGISGIDVNSQAMTVIGNNIANVNTTGFKASRLSFEDILNQSLTGSSIAMKAGRGVTVNGITPLFTQGSLESTASPTDMAIDGSGFFIIGDAKNNYYTRAGNFTLNQNGNLVNPAGLSVQGWKADQSGKINTSSTLSSINVSGVASAPLATDQITLGLNLDSASKNGDVYASSLLVYDSKGQEITLTQNLTYDEDAVVIGLNNIPAKHWQWAITSDTGTVSADSTGYFTFDDNGQLKQLYDSTGTLLYESTAAVTDGFVNPTINITNLPNGATIGQSGNITWSLLDSSKTANGSITGYASPSVTTSMQQNGYSTGALQSLSLDKSGVITGLFTNGQLQKVGQVAVADFISPWGLNPIGSNLFSETIGSGQPLVGVAGTAGKGEIKANSLEQSNVDLASEFVKMITTQRGFQANSRVITTTDAMLEEVVNLKR